MIECVPNFSEGRDPAKMRAIVDAIAAVPGVLMLGWESDSDHNRSVVTFAGEPERVMEGALCGVGKAAELIDLNHHEGVHPRVGAADVIPFVPLAGSTLEECVSVARRAGNRMWAQFGVPVYFYESAARVESRRPLQNVRRRGFDGAPPDVRDYASHPTAGAAVVGARKILIAYNVVLDTPDVGVAKSIARGLRESGGGFRFVKAMGVYLPSLGLAQVSMNLTNYAEIPLDRVYAAIVERAAVRSSQLVGFVPRSAYEMAPEFFRRTANWSESRVIENRIAELS